MYRTQRLRYQFTPAVMASAPSVVAGPTATEPVPPKRFRGSLESKVSSAYRSVTSHAPQPEFAAKGENGCRGSTGPFRTLFSPVSIQAPEMNQPAARVGHADLVPDDAAQEAAVQGHADRVLRLQLVDDRPLDLVCVLVGVRLLVAEGQDELPDPQRQLRTEPEVEIGVVQADLARTRRRG